MRVIHNPKGTNMMIQPIRLQGRLPVLALIAVTLALLASITLARFTSGSGPRTQAATPAVITMETVSTQRPSVQAPADKTGCASGAYVSGDLAGDASPAQIYAEMCGRR